MTEENYTEGVTVPSIEEALKHFREATQPRNEQGRISFKMSGRDVDLIWSTGELPRPKGSLSVDLTAESLEKAIEMLKDQLAQPHTTGRFAGCISFDFYFVSGEFCWDIEW